jgi:energy-converting hydrogenase Eha subunit B
MELAWLNFVGLDSLAAGLIEVFGAAGDPAVGSQVSL